MGFCEEVHLLGKNEYHSNTQIFSCCIFFIMCKQFQKWKAEQICEQIQPRWQKVAVPESQANISNMTLPFSRSTFYTCSQGFCKTLFSSPSWETKPFSLLSCRLLNMCWVRGLGCCKVSLQSILFIPGGANLYDSLLLPERGEPYHNFRASSLVGVGDRQCLTTPTKSL